MLLLFELADQFDIATMTQPIAQVFWGPVTNGGSDLAILLGVGNGA